MIKHIDDVMDSHKIKPTIVYKCHICNQVFETKAKAKAHLRLKKDELHNKYREKIDLLEKTYNDIDTIQELQCLGCDKYKCYNCQFINDCIKLEYNIYKKGKAKLHKIQLNINHQAKQLLQEFYNSINKECNNYRIEVVIIKNILHNYSYECVKTALLMQVEEGKCNIKGVSNFKAHDAKIYLEEIKPFLQEKNTIPYFITQYYDSLNLHIPIYQTIKDYQFVQKIKSAYKLNEEQIQFILQYAINKKVIPLTYIQSKIITILSSYQAKEIKQATAEKNYLSSAIDQLKRGEMTYIDLINIYGIQDIFISSIIQALKDNQFNQQYSAIEWLYNIKVPLTKDLYLLAKSNINGKLYHFTNDIDIQNFKSWLKNYKQKFEV